MVETFDKPCGNCGKPVTLEKPENKGGFDLMAGLSVLCQSCSEEAAAREAEEAAFQARELHGMRIIESGMPAKLRSVNFNALDITTENHEAIESAIAWSKGELPGLVLTGPVGVGKTWTAAAAANGYLERKPLRWFSVARMLAQYRAGFKNPARDEVNSVLLNPRLALVMDDIDKVNPTDFTRDILFQAIDERVNNDTALLVTTNMRYNELEKTYGEPIASRLAGYGKAARIDGEDRRRDV
jgi:DNA replication protein DnaC